MQLRRILLAITLATTSAASITPTFAETSGVAGAPHLTRLEEPPTPAIDRAALRTALDARRKTVIARFLAYRDAKVYPVNPGPEPTSHIWLDRFGHLCAAATLVAADWGRQASINAGKADVHLKIANVRRGPLADWILTSGLTRHELVAIQLPGSAVMRPPVEPKPTQPSPQLAETERMYQIYLDVERQLNALYDDSLDEATDALMQRPDLARLVLAGRFAPAGELAVEPHADRRFAQPPGKFARVDG